MLVKVSEDHILRGTRHSVNSCPIALALKEGNGWSSRMGVCASTAWDSSGEKVRRYWLPAVAAQFIKRFDTGRFVRPFEFELIRETE